VKYRPEIDGLRAIAVVAVIIYHAGLLPLPRGYLGVDIFFVISGYLITSIIAREIAEGSFTLRGFYARRARRILPALYAVTLVSLPLGIYFLIPEDLGDLAKSALAVILFVPNFYFWDTADYFARAAEFKPLIHTWSLGVEEQFYFLFPALMLLLAARGRMIALAVIIAASIAAAILVRPHDFDAVFYLLPFRAWQLAMGALAALLESRIRAGLRGDLAGDLMGSAGLALILLALLLPPGVMGGFTAQMVAVIGTTLGLLFIRQGTGVARLVGCAPLAGIGLISYSAYLWHQPLLAFARSVDGSELGTGVAIGLVALTFVLSYLSWRFIETPFRRNNSVPAKQFYATAVACFLAIGVGGMALAHATRDSDFLMSDLQKQVFRTAAKSPERERCHVRQNTYRAPGDACVFNTPPARIAVFGNSHGVELAYALGEALKPAGTGVAQFTYSGCPPLYGRTDPKDRQCSRWTADVVNHLASDSDIGTVVISYSLTSLIPAIGKDPESDGKHVTEATDSYFRTIDRLLTAGKRVVVVLQAPRLPRHIQYFIRDVRGPDDLALMPSVSTAEWTGRLQGLKAALIRQFGGRPGFQLVDPADVFCPGTSCAAILNGQALFFDEHHMSVAGAGLVAAGIAKGLAAP
jgi:peptidoglycan/LPS O-acetylase OafA/YrhL